MNAFASVVDLSYQAVVAVVGGQKFSGIFAVVAFGGGYDLHWCGGWYTEKVRIVEGLRNNFRWKAR